MEEIKNNFIDRQREKAFEEIVSLEDDRKLMESYYPQKAALLQAVVTDACDRLDYEGSFIYDEYPDRWNIERNCRDICRQAEEIQELHAMEKKGEDELLGEFVGSLFCQEIYQRRCRRKFLKRLAHFYKTGGFGVADFT